MSNLEIAKLYKRIYHLENINKIKNEDYYTYKIDDFGIIYLNHIIIDKNYYYIKPESSIYLSFSGYLISNGIANLTFRINILDDNDKKLYSIDKNIELNGRFNFDMSIDIMKELLNTIIQFVVLGKEELFKPGQMYMNGYYFKNCMIYIRFIILDEPKLSHIQYHIINMPTCWK